MDKKSKILLWIVILMTVSTVGATYYRIFIKGDYIIKMEADCDPKTETCLTREPDENNPEQSYYKIVEQKASNLR